MRPTALAHLETALRPLDCRIIALMMRLSCGNVPGARRSRSCAAAFWTSLAVNWIGACPGSSATCSGVSSRWGV